LKQLLKSSSIYVFLGFLPMGVNFLLAPLYSHILSPEENALLGQAIIFQSFLSIFLNLSIDSAFSRFYFDYYKDEVLLKKYMSTIINFIILLSCVSFVVLSIFGDGLFSIVQKNKTFSFHKYGVWVFLTAFCIVIQSIFLAYYRNCQKPLKFSLVSLSFFFSGIILILIGLLVFKAGALGSIIGRAAGYAIITIILLVIFYRQNGISFEKKLLKESLRYSIPIIPYIVLMNLYGNIDRILIERYFTLNELGIYNFAFLLSGAVSVFVSSCQNAIGPVIYKVLADQEEGYERRVSDLFKMFHFVNTAIITVGLAVTVQFVQLFIAPAYHSILNYIGILFLSFIFRVYYLVYVDSLFFYKKTRWISLITLISFLIGVSSNLILIPKLGIMGVCISVLIINLTQAIGAYVQLRLYKLNLGLYNLNYNHLYTFFILAAYFIPLINSGYCQTNTNAYNYWPLGITILFSVIFFIRNKDTLKQKIKLPF